MTNLQALWADRRASVAGLGSELPGGPGWKDYLAAWVERCQAEPGLWNAGRQREFGLAQDAERVRAILVEALEEVGALAEAETPK